ncbi:MAG: STAS/SEC14 domain-containing protein [Anaerolineae bacterium]|nr:STAS/SEC14 domain-containing protein [Anaerolineae bacterium]MCB9129515.1 STAS/SEC14 domain-containing protein [Anaerolineales bacterium]MCB0232242.1 STAS/SEC14 domain-containing protein [Anaerolineae bacterium]MCB0233162.1 STAS/SEC14 domain-containing protein [Anaerolineae bacterium]MCB0249859.1 STAS/SEC14 domain-containing protein [Anaerolineae bacterium]
MFEVLPQSTDTSIGFRVSGKVSAQDYQQLMPRLDEAIASHGKINLLVVVEDFDGYDGLDAAKADLHFGTNEYRQVEKAAFVGDGKWMARIVKIMDPFTRNTDERTFALDQLDEAWAWITSDA